MTLEFVNLDAKLGTVIEKMPNKTADHTYLEALLQDRLESGNVKLYTAKMYEGVVADDLERLKAQDIHLVLANGKTAYFADGETAEMMRGETFQNFSDAVAYGSLPVSTASSSVIKPKGRVLVIDDETKGGPNWGSSPVLMPDGTEVDQAALQRAANSLGDCYGLVSRDLHGSLSAQQIVEGAVGKVGIARTSTLEGKAVSVESAIMFDVADSLGLINDPLKEGFLSYKEEDFEIQNRRDGTQVVKWQMSQTQPDGSDRVLQGKTLIEPTIEGGSRLTTIGGDEGQQKEINKTFHRVSTSYDTPFQFRAGVPEWQGVMKGTARTSDLCRQLGVDAIIPKSAIKGDGKTVQVGVQAVDNLYWARKSDAADRQQKLGAQVLVNFPEGTRSDVMPKLKEQLETLAAAQNDPRKLADLYMAQHEKKTLLIEEQDSETVALGEDEFAAKEDRVDWLYEVLKADARPTTVVNGIRAENGALADLPNEVRQEIEGMAQSGLEISEFVEQANLVLAEAETTEPQATYERFSVETVAPNFTTETTGGYGQILEHEKVVAGLQKFAKGQWTDGALGGIYVPSALAQPHAGLRQSDPDNNVVGEICCPKLPHGAKFAVYRSPVANVAAFRVFENNLEGMKKEDIEAYRQSGVVYMNPKDAKELVIDFDGDTIAMIPEDQFERLHAEITALNAPDKRPVQVEKERKIPRNANDPAIAALPPEEQAMAKRFTSIEIAAVDAADNPTGSVANTLMKLEALRWETQYVFDREAVNQRLQANGTPPEQVSAALVQSEVDVKQKYLQKISSGFGKVQKRTLGENPLVIPEPGENPLVIPEPTKDGFDFRRGVTEIAQSSRTITASDPAKKLEQLDLQLGKVERFLFQVEGIGAVNLQRAVDTPKSARVVSTDELEFCRAVTKYKDVDWVANKKNPTVFLNDMKMPTNTQDPVGWMATQANGFFEASGLDKQSLKVYDGIFPKDGFTEEQSTVAKEVVQEYSSAIALSKEIEDRAKTEEGPALQLKTADGKMIEVTNLTKFDPKGESPIWEAARNGKAVEIELVDNKEDFKTGKSHNYAAQATINGQTLVIGTLSEKSQLDIARSYLQTENPKRLAELERDFERDPKGMKEALKNVEIEREQVIRASSELVHQYDADDAKEMRVTANENLQSWAKSIPEEDRASWSAALWQNRGQKVAMMVMPEQVQAQLEQPQLNATSMTGMNFAQTNEWHGHEWGAEPVSVRFAMGVERDHYDPAIDENHPHYGKVLIQAQTPEGEWKTVAPANHNNEYYQIPLGTTAMATITPQGVAGGMVAITPEGKDLPLKPIPGVELQPTGDGETLKVCFIKEGKGKDITAYIATVDNPPQKLAQLNQTAQRKLEKAERETGHRLFNNPGFVRQVSIVPPRITSAKVTLDPNSVVIPEQWTKRNPEAWKETLATIQEREVTASKSIEGQLDSANDAPAQTIETESEIVQQEPEIAKEAEQYTEHKVEPPVPFNAETALQDFLKIDGANAEAAQTLLDEGWNGRVVPNTVGALGMIEFTNPQDDRTFYFGSDQEEWQVSDPANPEWEGLEPLSALAVTNHIGFEPADPRLSTLLQSEGAEGAIARDLKEMGFVMAEGGSKGYKDIRAIPLHDETGIAANKQLKFCEGSWTMTDINGDNEVTDLQQIAATVETLKADYLGKSEATVAIASTEAVVVPVAELHSQLGVETPSVTATPPQSLPKPTEREVATDPLPVPLSAPKLEDLGFRTDTPQAVITLEEGKHQLVANLYETVVSDVQGGRSLQSSAISLEKGFHEPGDVVVMVQEGLLMSDIGELTPESKIRLSEIETQLERNLAAEGVILPIEQVQVTNVPERAVEKVEAAIPLEKPVPNQAPKANAATPIQSLPPTPVPVPLTPIQQAMQTKYDERRDAAIGMLKTIGVEQVTAEQIDMQIAKSIQLTTHPSRVEQEMNVLGRSPVTQALKNSEGVQVAQGYVHKVWEASLPPRSQTTKPTQRKPETGR